MGNRYKKDSLGTRMKENYENVPKIRLIKRMPVVIRLDGVAFHTFTRGLKRPFDDILRKSMCDTMLHLCKNIQGCCFGYTQSDEISLLLVDYKTLNTDAWYDYELEKMCSVSASMATLAFNKAFETNVQEYINNLNTPYTDKELSYVNILRKKVDKGGFFDARCFNIPKEEVCNLFYWRQIDARRNSISMLAQSFFSAKELHKKDSETKKIMCLEKGVNWDSYANEYKWGISCLKKDLFGIKEKNSWYLDKSMPLLKDTNRDYIEKYVFVGE